MLVRPVRPARRADRGTSGKLQRIANVTATEVENDATLPAEAKNMALIEIHVVPRDFASFAL